MLILKVFFIISSYFLSIALVVRPHTMPTLFA
jgi:hypothetical protein